MYLKARRELNKFKEFYFMRKKIGKIGFTGNIKIILIQLVQATHLGNIPSIIQMELFNGKKFMLFPILMLMLFVVLLWVSHTMILVILLFGSLKDVKTGIHRYIWTRIYIFLRDLLWNLLQNVMNVSWLEERKTFIR